VIRYLLDTNIVSDLVRSPHGRIRGRIFEVGEDQVCISIIVAAEIRFGVARRGSTRLAEQLETILTGLQIVPFEAPADSVYADVRTSLQRSGQLISANDMLIAAHAIALDCTIVTANEREFARVPGLDVENWLQE
jgi:tRNA(fMet)-specific endonuclease VapC